MKAAGTRSDIRREFIRSTTQGPRALVASLKRRAEVLSRGQQEGRKRLTVYVKRVRDTCSKFSKTAVNQKGAEVSETEYDGVLKSVKKKTLGL